MRLGLFWREATRATRTQRAGGRGLWTEPLRCTVPARFSSKRSLLWLWAYVQGDPSPHPDSSHSAPAPTPAPQLFAESQTQLLCLLGP